MIANKTQQKLNRKEEARLARLQPQETDHNCGSAIMCQSQTREGLIYTEITQLNSQHINSNIRIRARIQTIRGKGNLIFIILRQQFHTIQAVASKDFNSKQLLKFIPKITPESIVDIVAKVQPALVTSCTIQEYELLIESIFIISAANHLPILLSDAERPEALLTEQRQTIKNINTKITELKNQLQSEQNLEEVTIITKPIIALEHEKQQATKYVDISLATRLDNRIVDLRTGTNQAIFRIQSGVCQLFREFLLKLNFTEIHTPKIISAASEGGADVFKLGYFGKDAFLAQSPQLYKQMCICADMNRVFEIAPVFRSENSNTHRHMTEFIGLDMELAFNEHYHEVLDILEELFFFMFEQINIRYRNELEVIRHQYPSNPLLYDAQKPIRLTHDEAIALLKTVKPDIEKMHDIGTNDEKVLGQLVHDKYQTDFYLIDKYPTSQRPFYTMPDPNNPAYSNSYDFFIRGEEILSGAQRIHDPTMLEQSAVNKGINIEKLKDYINAFRFGVPPHGGGGIGLERVVMLFLGLPNIRLTSLYPRTPDRMTP
jgi:aspartyl-tRNA synthetase